MKKLAIAAAAAAALTSGVVNAYETAKFSNGFVVPYVYHNGPNDQTVVGLLSNGNYAVHWFFYDQDATLQFSGCFVMDANRFLPFEWAKPRHGTAEANVSHLANVRGYLVFAVGTDSSGTRDTASFKTSCSNPLEFYLPGSTSATGAAQQALSGAAFHVRSASNDVAYVPVINGPLASADSASLATTANSPVSHVAGAVDGNDTHFLRFYTAGGAKTEIVIWNSGAYNAGSGSSPNFNKSATLYQPQGQGLASGHPVQLSGLKHRSLNILDPSSPTSIGGVPVSANDGSIRWQPMTSATTQGVFTFSVINAPQFGALQTIINPYVRN